MTDELTPKPPLDHERHAFTPRPGTTTGTCVCGLWESHHMHTGVSSATCTCMGCIESRDGAAAAWGLPHPTFRVRLGDALNATPHFTVRETVATVMRVLGEQHGDLREQLDAALRTVGLARNLSAYRDAVLPVVEAALAEQATRKDSFQVRAERSAHDAECERVWNEYPKVIDALREQTQRAEKAEAAVERVRRLCELTIDNSIRLQAIDQARDTITVLDEPEGAAPASEEPTMPVEWEAIARQRERELKQVGEARHQAEAAVQRSREALARFDGRGVNNFDVPTPGEVLDAWRASLDQPEAAP